MNISFHSSYKDNPRKELSSRKTIGLDQGKKQFVLVLGIIVLATLIRLLSLHIRSLWFDEAFSFFVASQDLPGLIRATAADNHPPLYYLLLHYWLNFGSSEATLRLLSLIPGVLSIPLIFTIGKKLSSPKTGFWAAVILALSPLNVYFSQEARMYTLAIFINLAAFLFFLQLIQKNSLALKLGFILSLTLGLYTHYYFLFSWLAFNLIFFSTQTHNRQQLTSWLSTQFLICLLFLPWVIVFVNNQHPQPWQYPLILAIPATFTTFAVGGVGSTTLKTILLDSNVQHIKLAIITLGSWMGFLFLKAFRLKSLFSRSITTSFLLVPIATVAIFSLIKPIYSPRSLIIFSPFYYLVIAITISSLKPKILELSTLLLTILLNLTVLVFMHSNPLFWGSPLKIIAQKPFIDYQPGDVIAHASIYSYYPFRYYHQDQLPDYLIFDSGLSERTTRQIGGTPTPIEVLTNKYQRLWFVGITFLSPPQDIQSTLNHLSAKYRLADSVKHDHIEIYLFDIIATE